MLSDAQELTRQAAEDLVARGEETQPDDRAPANHAGALAQLVRAALGLRPRPPDERQRVRRAGR